MQVVGWQVMVVVAIACLHRWWWPSVSEMVPPMNSDESGRSGGAYASLGTRQEGGRFEDVGLSLCALPLQILVLRFQRTEF